MKLATQVCNSGRHAFVLKYFFYNFLYHWFHQRRVYHNVKNIFKNIYANVIKVKSLELEFFFIFKLFLDNIERYSIYVLSLYIQRILVINIPYIIISMTTYSMYEVISLHHGSRGSSSGEYQEIERSFSCHSLSPHWKD